MKLVTLLFSIVVILIVSACLCLETPQKGKPKVSSFPYEEYALASQADHFGEGLNEYKRAVQRELLRMKQKRSTSTPWTMEGPLNVGGRINCLAIHPTNSNTYLAGFSEGGIFRTIDGGNTWVPIFDNAWSLSVSCVVYDSTNPQVIYVGTGDQVLGGYSHVGNGVYKSTDGGNTWQNIGLSNTGMIAKIVIDPNNHNTLYVASSGNPFTSDNNRGLYKSIDAGATWTQILFLNQNTGVDDIAIHTINSDTLYCTGRYRLRSTTNSVLVGPKTKIYRSFNGGATWDTLGNGLPSTPTCLIGLAIPGNSSNTLYASYVDDNYDFGGLYKSVNNGSTWSLLTTTSANMGGFGWYFGEVRINPFNANHIFIGGVDLTRSTNGGTLFNAVGSGTHSDKHDVAFVNSTTVLLATDGGFYKSTDGGNSFTPMNNFPVTQFYRVAYNPFTPTEYYGGAQDNGSLTGSSTTGINQWGKYYGADGFQSQFDSNNPDIWYAEWQNGNIVASTDGGFSFTNIFSSINSVERCSWNTPYFVSNFNTQDLYAGTYRVHKNTMGPFATWSPISPDLTNGTANTYHVITALHQSPINQQKIIVGTSDARVWYTADDGTNWTQINAGLPIRYISSVKASPDNINSFVVTCSGYRNNDTLPHVYLSTNNGANWTSIAGNLPNFAINDVWIRPGSHDSSLLIASDGGVYATMNQGQTWNRVGSNMPIIPVFDIEFNPSTQRIFVGTFARSIQSMPIDSVFEVATMHVGFSSLQKKENSISIYPSPTQNMLHVVATNQPTELIIRNAWGALVQRVQINSLNHSIDVTSFSAGIYYINTTSNNSAALKFIKE